MRLPLKKVEELDMQKLSELCDVFEEHQASEPWCSCLLLIQCAKGHISSCYHTTSISTMNQVQ